MALKAVSFYDELSTCMEALTFLQITVSFKIPIPTFEMARKRCSGQTIKYKTIRTERLQLREARKGDLDDFHEFFSNPDVMRYWAPTHTTIDQTKSYLNRMMEPSTNGDVEFVIVLPASNPLDHPSSTAVSKEKVIGTAGIWDEANGEIELMLHRDFWGHGYMSEALTAMIPIFWQKGLEKLVADVDPRNEGSLKVLNKLGFVEAGSAKNTSETDIGWCDSVYLELRRPSIS